MNKIVVDKVKLKSYRLKITALSPLHIGTGQVYDPTKFVIDQNKLFAFDEVLFYKTLSIADKELFEKSANDYMQIIDFYKSKKEEAIKIAHFECDASDEVQNAYERQRNKDNSKNKNQFEIQTTFKNPNTLRAIIPGSSIKGMLNTALQIYSPKVKENIPRQNLIISDAQLLKGGVEIGRADRRHKIVGKNSKDGIYQRIEVVKPLSEFVMSMSSKFSFEDLKVALKRYHQERESSRFESTKNSFVARVGKNEGKEYVVDDGRNVLNSEGKPVATHFLYNSNTLTDEEFGWIKIEQISENEYEQSLKDISTQEMKYYEDLKESQRETKEKILKLELEAKQKQLQKEQAKLQEEKEIQEAKRKEAEEFSKMSPLERKIKELLDATPMPKTTLILKKINDGTLDEFKDEAIDLLVATMKKDGEWKEKSAKKNPAKDKEYQKTLEVKKLLEG